MISRQVYTLSLALVVAALPTPGFAASSDVLSIDFNGHNVGESAHSQTATSVGAPGGEIWNLVDISDENPNTPNRTSGFAAADGSPTDVTIAIANFQFADACYECISPNGLGRDYIGYTPGWNPTPTILLGGLFAGVEYTLYLHGSNFGAPPAGATFTAGGLSGTTISNGLDYVQLTDVLADSTGEILITITDGNAAGFAIVNGLEIVGPFDETAFLDEFKRGDANANGVLDIADVSHNLTYQFVGSLGSSCIDALDVNDDGAVAIDDPLYALFHMFAGGAAIPAPGADECGIDPTEDSAAGDLGCLDYPNTACRGIVTGGNAREVFEAWMQTHVLADDPDPPFSFRYGGQSSGSFLSSWTFERTSQVLDANRTQWTLTYTDPATSLIVRCELTEYKDYPAAEWVLWFENSGFSNTPIIDDVQTADLTFASADAGNFVIHHNRGSTPPAPTIRDFEPFSRTLTSSLRIVPGSGRSSEDNMPFFNLESPDDVGAALAIGWTGQWEARFARTSSTTASFEAGMEHLRTRLLPREEIRVPSVLMVFWSSEDRFEGHNQMRRIIVDHYTPRPGGQELEPVIAASVHGMYGFDGATNETNMLGFVDLLEARNMPVDFMWIDAGWYATFPDNQWVWTGTWDPHPQRFPNGLDPIADAAHAAGYGFLVWFEPERSMDNNWLDINHPSWLLPIPGSSKSLLDLGNPSALDWAKDKFSNMIGNIGIDIYRHDCNIYPLLAWQNADSFEREGILEIRHVMGLYDYFDTLLADHPDLLIDQTASGGTRYDIEMLKRAVVLWRSDKTWGDNDFPHSAQAHHYGLAHWIPYQGLGTISPDPYHFRSGMGSFFTIAINLNSASTSSSVRNDLLRLRQITHLYHGDFYPLTPYSISTSNWLAKQYNRPDIGEGLVQAFRRQNNSTTTMTFKLRGLERGQNYLIRNWDVVGNQTISGNQLMDVGLPVTINGQPGAAVITYEKL
jgi:alpha-galactosidase